MNVFEFVIAILVLAFLGKAVKAHFDSKRNAQTMRQDEQKETDANLERLAQLEERIRVLERIVTDEELELKREFRNL